MTVQEVYEKYRIMPNLQLHQLRVAAVGKTIAENMTRSVDVDAITLACLFHDMGNIIKSHLDSFPEFIPASEVPLWQKVKDEFVAKYGSDEHDATIEMAGEIGLPPKVIRLIDGVGFSKLPITQDSDSYEQKIVEYSDLRVDPHGIVPMQDRIEESRRRYSVRHEYAHEFDDRYPRFVDAGRTIERQIFDGLSIQPEDLTNESLAGTIESLRSYEIS